MSKKQPKLSEKAMGIQIDDDSFDDISKVENIEEEHEIEIVKDHEIIQYPLKVVDLPTEDEIDKHVAIYNYVKKKVVDKNDFANIKGKRFLKKSGVRKFINAFNISVELVEKQVYELEVNGVNDLHAEVRVRATTPKSQAVEGIGIKSMSELFDKSLHNLIATAWTRATNRAILDLVAFGEVSAEEIKTSGNTKDDSFE